MRKVRDWYVSSFRDLRTFSGVKDSQDEVRRGTATAHSHHDSAPRTARHPPRAASAR